MNDKEALERFKDTKEKYDEGQKHNELKGDTIGYFADVAIGLIVALFNYFYKIVSYDIFSVLLLGEGVSNIYRFVKNKRRKDLIIALFCLVAGILFFVRHVKQISM